MKFRAVLFDAAETLFTTRGSVGEIYASVAREYGSHASADAIQRAFVRHFRGAGPISIQDQRHWWKDVVHRVFSEVGMVENFDDFFDRVYDTFRDGQGWTLFPETLEALKQLRDLGLKLGIISNFDTRIYSVLDSLGIRRFFDTVTISSETGYSKPDPEIFESAVRDLGVPATAVLLVGDSPHDDVEPAMRAGLAAILIDRKNRYSAKSALRRISSLKEVIREVTS
jgi:putative hydrolase of the HAD superfamily